ncbi:SDR family oxidoreductase [Shinella sp. WSJ-2]|uniref:SDR family NAD(P)-dependent oxidoreductase n=1 Tax=Shinella sp. WSJ-2 TaxID=2303749 RepID=UPI000E3BDD82|nr:SDR family oxidoreductase [Shinella sp. WSJ-2]RFZ88307.1 SDR family oxidoreductase [Shinella sp. WSJ-2]
MTLTTTPGTALVTGASAGIGATYADRLARRGHDLVLVARDGARLSALAETLKAKHGVAVDVLRADLSAPDDLRAVERRIREDRAITIVVNNAGIGPKGALLADDIDYLDTMIALNVTAANRLAVAAAQAFTARGEGTIINIASAVAIVPEVFNGAYSGTKAFVLAFTQSLAQELNGTGVRLQAVLPGLTRTEIFDRAGGSVESLDPNRVMDVADLVDAALAGLDQGELVTIPSLPDRQDWENLEATRLSLGPNISHNKPAARYAV